METPRLRSPIETLFWDELGPALLFAFILVILAAFDWLTALARRPPQPWLFTAFAAAASLYAVGKFARLRARLRRMARGRDGEQVAPEELGKLGADGTEVTPDVAASGARAPRHHAKRSEACSLEPGQISAQWQRAYCNSPGSTG
jgi:hypothetical protein